MGRRIERRKEKQSKRSQKQNTAIKLKGENKKRKEEVKDTGRSKIVEFERGERQRKRKTPRTRRKN